MCVISINYFHYWGFCVLPAYYAPQKQKGEKKPQSRRMHYKMRKRKRLPEVKELLLVPVSLSSAGVFFWKDPGSGKLRICEYFRSAGRFACSTRALPRDYRFLACTVNGNLMMYDISVCQWWWSFFLFSCVRSLSTQTFRQKSHPQTG